MTIFKWKNIVQRQTYTIWIHVIQITQQSYLYNKPNIKQA